VKAGRSGALLGAAILASGLLVGSCGAAPGGSAKPTATPAPPAGPRVVLPSGAVYAVELARTPEEQVQGLMFRESLAEKSGMLFLFPDNTVHQFWMKNTMIPLDIIWMDHEGKVLFASENTPPCKIDPCPTYGPDRPATSVLEIAAGMAKKEKVEVGSVIRFVDLK
jgi:uncharacterized membrane protein (UPF0127 family)